MAKTENLMIKMVLDNKDFLKSMGVTQQQVKSFGSGMSNVMSIVGKAAGALGVATTAYEALNKVMHSSQTLGDAAANSMASVKNVVDNLAYSIGSWDWSNFNNGLADMAKKAYEASAALDQLGNTRMSYNYFTSKWGADFQEAITTMKDENSSAESRKAAEDTADALLGKQSDLVGVLTDRLRTAMNNLMVNKINLSSDMVDDDFLDAIMNIDAVRNSDELKNQVKSRYESWNSQKANAKTANTKQVWNSQKRWNELVLDEEGLKKSEEILDRYYAKDAVIFNALEKNDDDYIQSLVSMAQEIDNARRNLTSMERQLNKTGSSMAKALNGGSSSSGKNSTDTSTPIGTINVLNAEISELRKQISSSTNPILISTLYDQLTKAEHKLAMINEGMSVTWEKGGEIAAPGYTAPTALNGFTAEMGGELSEYSDGIDDLTTALDGMFSVMRNGEPDFKSFLSMMGTLIGGAIGGAGGASIGGTIANGIGNLLAKDMSSTPTVTVRGSDLRIALNNYNKRMN